MLKNDQNTKKIYNLGSVIILRGNQGRDSRKTKEKSLNLQKFKELNNQGPKFKKEKTLGVLFIQLKA